MLIKLGGKGHKALRVLARALKPVMVRIAKGKWDPLFLRSPFVVNAYMRARFEYVTDKELFGIEDRPQTAIEMLEREKGDCEDWAEAARALLAPGYGPFLFYVGVRDKGEARAHMACVFLDDEKYSYIHTGGYRRRIVPERAITLIPAEIDLAAHIAADVYPGARVEDYYRTGWNGERWQPVGL